MIQRDVKLGTNEITDGLIKYIIDKIVKEIHPDKIILFGSHAQRTATKDSDLDLFIINLEIDGVTVHANVRGEGTVPVGQFPTGISPWLKANNKKRRYFQLIG